MLAKPYFYYNNLIYDATQEYIFKFNVNGGDQIFKNEIKIQDISTNVVVYTDIIESFQLQHIIPANKLINKKEYKIQIRTYNLNNKTSEWSDYFILKCIAKPIVNVVNLEKDVNGDNIIRNQTYNFRGTVAINGDKIKSYRYYLYDRDRIIIDKSISVFNSSLEYQFTGLEDEKKYYIELKVLTQNNIEATSGLILFIPRYVKPRIKNALKLTNDYDNGQIKIQTNVIQVLFRVLNGKISYEDNEWINLKNGSIIAEQKDGFAVKGDWTLKMWIKDLKEDVSFLELYDKNNSKIEFKMYNDKIHIFKIQNNIPYHILSDKLGITSQNDVIFIFAQKIGEYMNLTAKKV